MYPAAATVHSTDDGVFVLTWLAMRGDCLRHRHTLFSLPYVMPPFATLLWDTGREMGQTEGSGVESGDLVHCTWNVQSSPTQMCRTQEQTMMEMFPVEHRSQTAQVYPQVSLCNGVLKVSNCYAAKTSLKKSCQTPYSHPQLRSLPALTSPVVGRLHQ